MEELRKKVEEAMKVADMIVAKAAGEVVDISEEDKAVLQKYIDLGVIQYTKRRIVLSREIYFPLLQHEAFRDLTVDIWRRVTLWAMNKHNVGSKLSKASADDYMSKANYKYSIRPTVLLRSEASAKQKRQEAELIEEFNL
jgi:hypothetical protein